MRKALLVLAAFVCVGLPTRADSIYYNFFSMIEIDAPGAPYEADRLFQFALPIGAQPNVVSCNPFIVGDCVAEYFNVPYYYTTAFTLPNAQQVQSLNVPLFDPRTPGLPTTGVYFQNPGNGGEGYVALTSAFFETANIDTPLYSIDQSGVLEFNHGLFVNADSAGDRYMVITSDVPEPSTFVLIGMGIAGLMGAVGRRFVAQR